MKLAELIIENFRGIGSQSVRVKIDNIIVLIGKNNVGKTTVLSAYEAFASTGAPLRLKDFYNEDIKNKPKIAGIFVDVADGELAKKWIHDDKLLGYKNCIKAQYQWSSPDVNGEKLSYNPATGLFEKGGMGGFDSILTSKIPTPLKISPLDDPLELEKKILEILIDAIKQNTKKDNSKVQQLLNDIRQLAEDVQTEISEELTRSCTMVSEEMMKVFPEATIIQIDPQASKIEPDKLIGSGSFIRLGSNEQHLAPLSNHGTGLQRTFLWSALKMLADTGRHQVKKKSIGAGTQKILLLEEPEAFLHPSAIRNAMESLYAIAEHEDWQVMVSSHSPVFIDLTKDHTTVIRIEKEQHAQHATHTFSTDEATFTDDDKENLKMLNYCNPYFNEFFFSTNNLLVEGETEVTVVKSLMQIGRIEKDCIHVINCLGKANLVTVSKILNHFKVNYSILHDADSPKVKRDGKYIVNSMWTVNLKINNEIEFGRKKGLEIKSFLSVPNFEGEYFEGVTGSSKPFGAWKVFTEEGNEVVERFAQIIDKITGKENNCGVEYFNIADLARKVSKYIVDKGLSSDQHWKLTDEDRRTAVNE
ncbi:ATP-dependent nuclease [Cohnella silvisoli]|uniref:AAA family ATPase n=1 Tax=Cohnella silvisoli TaxID=2873699 RepID=A0ABV1KX40_9BACL|nr:AAA family ATPase [Cohnella silvisoli]MCD9023444.1 AAA family ATPase [Cohnella silvisoli]